jgi:hypothetical protein
VESWWCPSCSHGRGGEGRRRAELPAGAPGALREPVCSGMSPERSRLRALLCPRCGRERPRSRFRGRNKIPVDGRLIMCRSCERDWWSRHARNDADAAAEVSAGQACYRLAVESLSGSFRPRRNGRVAQIDPPRRNERRVRSSLAM